MKKLNSKKKKGFTLIELVIVVAILGILAGVAIPKFSAAQTEAKKNADISNGKSIASAVTMLTAQSATVDGDSIKAQLNSVPTPQSRSGAFSTTTSGDIVVYIHTSTSYYEVYPQYKDSPETGTVTATDIE